MTTGLGASAGVAGAVAGQDKLRITANMPDLTARVSQVKATIKALAA